MHRTRHLAEAGYRGRPRLVLNVETIAMIALVVRAAGGGEAAALSATRLFTVTGDVAAPGVYEAPADSSVGELLARAGAPMSPGRVLGGGYALVGGFHGRWVDEASARKLASAGTGAGIVHRVGPERCPLMTVAWVAGELAEAAAGQCGPCRFGLPELASCAAEIAAAVRVVGRRADLAERRIDSLAAEVDGRGACAHPDGAVRFLRSSQEVLAAEFAAHRRGECTAMAGAEGRSTVHGAVAGGAR